MCYKTSIYHEACQHWCKPTIELCIRATAGRGLSNGCSDTIDLGSESASKVCRRCRHDRMLSSAASSVGESEYSRSSSASSRPCTSRVSEESSTSEHAERILSFLPASIRQRQQQQRSKNNDAAGLLKPSSAERAIGGTSVGDAMTNSHWRMYDERGYGPT